MDSIWRLNLGFCSNPALWSTAFCPKFSNISHSLKIYLTTIRSNFYAKWALVFMRNFRFFFVKMLKINTLVDSQLPHTYFMDTQKPLNVEIYNIKFDLIYIWSLTLHIIYQKIDFGVIEIFFQKQMACIIFKQGKESLWHNVNGQKTLILWSWF